MLPLLIGAWITITTPAPLYTPDTVVLVMECLNTVPDSYLSDINNYSLVDEQSTNIPIQSVTLLSELDGVSCPITKLVAMVIPRPNAKKSYIFTATDLGSYSFYDYGYGMEIIPGDITAPSVESAELLISNILFEGQP